MLLMHCALESIFYELCTAASQVHIPTRTIPPAPRSAISHVHMRLKGLRAISFRDFHESFARTTFFCPPT